MKQILLFLFILIPINVHAECSTISPPCVAAKDPVTIWLTTGVRSYHEDRVTPYNENNTGYGLEIRFDCDHALYVGHYQNSIHRLSEYVGYAWQPVTFGNLHIGFLNVIATGYTKTGRGTIIAPVPMASYDWKSVGINVIIIPSIVTAIQLKVKIL